MTKQNNQTIDKTNRDDSNRVSIIKKAIKITIASGKGGVGKSSISASLALALSKKHKIICADCDVDASNLALVFGLTPSKFKEWNKITTNKQAVLIPDKCTGCKKCYEECYFDAILWDDKNKLPVFKEFGCEGCNLCKLVCKENAIKMVNVHNAMIGYAETKYGFKIVSAQLLPGNSGSGKIVTAVKNLAEDLSNNSDVMLVDSAAGIGCSVTGSITGSDFVISVTEPTPSGLSDLKRLYEIIFHFGILSGIVINKHNLNEKIEKQIELFAEQNNIPILSKIKFDKNFNNALKNLVPIIEYDKK